LKPIDEKFHMFEIPARIFGKRVEPAMPEAETGKYAEELSEYAVYPFYSLHDTRLLLALPPLEKRIKP